LHNYYTVIYIGGFTAPGGGSYPGASIPVVG